MTAPYDADDLGLDLMRAKALPECHACRKKSDGHVKHFDGTVLCGTHADEYFRVYLAAKVAVKPAEWAAEQRAGKYKACWEAKEE